MDTAGAGALSVMPEETALAMTRQHTVYVIHLKSTALKGSAYAFTLRFAAAFSG